MKRERLEDLGRIRVLLEYIGELNLFEIKPSSVRNKDFVDWFREQPEDNQDDILHNLIYRIDELNEKISECICIARGHDDE